MRNLLALTAVFALSAPACASLAPGGGVDMATARRIERQVRLPEGAAPLAGYARFYYRDARRRDVVVGQYYRSPNPGMPSWPSPGIYLTLPPVGVDDGGCDAVSLTYDPVGARITSIACNGDT